MRLFIFEDICGGGRCYEPLENQTDTGVMIQSLFSEAAAMLQAVIDDFSKLSIAVIGGPLEITTQWDRRVGNNPFADLENVECIKIDSPRAGQLAWTKSLSHSDAVLTIAPELGGRAYALQLEVVCSGARSLNSSPEAIQLCSDKLKFCGHLQQHRISTIPTFASYSSLQNCNDVVVKVRDGAGSIGARKMKISEAEAHSIAGESDHQIWQPFIAGDACSVGCFVNSESGNLTVLPAARQLLSDDETLQYEGGEIPATNVPRQKVIDMATQVARSIKGLDGYFGIDFILDHVQNLIVVEVNPRYTTSYVGYRAMTPTNLAELSFCDFKDRDIEWQNSVRFDANGQITTRPMTEEEFECCRH